MVIYLDQELISYSYSCCCCCFSSCWIDRLQKSPRLRRFKSDRDEIWQDCSSSKYASIDGVGLRSSILRQAVLSNNLPYLTRRLFFLHNDAVKKPAAVFTARCTVLQSAVLRLHVFRPSVCLSVTLVDQDHTGWKSWKLIARTISPTPSGGNFEETKGAVEEKWRAGAQKRQYLRNA